MRELSDSGRFDNRVGSDDSESMLDHLLADTGWVSRAARLFLRLLEIVRSMIAPQLMHFQA
jgi:hypothetical protein